MRRFILGVAVLWAVPSSGAAVGMFEGATDIGSVGRAGSVECVRDGMQYVVTGSGANIWGSEDAFHFVWRKVSGDVTAAAKIDWRGTGLHPHRKAGWMLRQSLDPDAPYVDVVVHGDGLISLQYRRERGGPTEEIQSPTRGPATIQLERHGDVFTLSLSRDGDALEPVGSLSVSLKDPVYAGLAVCSHDNATVETAVFSKVRFEAMGKTAAGDRVVESTLEIISAETGQRHVVYRARRHFEAPNWSPDGSHLLFNGGGRLYTIPAGGGEPALLNTGPADRCNNDHGFSPDGKWLALSHHHEGHSRIFIVPAAGGTPRLVTPLGPSYWHGWSPDGKTLVYCAARDGEYDVYTIPAAGGPEKQLTDAEGLNDGPEYSPDGRFIYFNSERTGQMRIWRMNADGSEQEQVTRDEQYADWFPHPSPDGKLLVFLSYDRSVQGHPAHKDV
ncbi:MAG: TolB family protein, partial [Sedimentisphaerales bacterium]|nr:TolB family protein [Sedimentisphaerales bacterium]